MFARSIGWQLGALLCQPRVDRDLHNIFNILIEVSTAHSSCSLLDVLLGGNIRNSLSASVNHPRQTQVKGAKVVGLYKVTSNPWKPKAHGVLTDGLGLALVALGFVRLLAPSVAQTFFIR
jgi:hypothetical protein